MRYFVDAVYKSTIYRFTYFLPTSKGVPRFRGHQGALRNQRDPSEFSQFWFSFDAFKSVHVLLLGATGVQYFRGKA